MRYKLFKKLADIFFPIILDFEVINKPDLSQNEGALLAVNHIHALDPLFVSYAAYPTWIHHIAKHDIFKIPILPMILKKLGVIPINRERPGANSIKRTLKLFNQGKIVCIFPQGTRQTKTFGKIKKGAARLALKAKVNLYPVAITGLEKINFLGFFKHPKIKIIFGQPLNLAGIKCTKEEIMNVTAELEISIKKLYGKISLAEN